MKHVFFTTNGRSFPSFANLPQTLAAAALTLALLAAVAARATPYASGLTNDNGTIRFWLNEAADSVQVIFDGGAGGTNDLGALAAGRHSFALGAATSYQIVVQKSGAPGWLVGVTNQISADTNRLVTFVNQRGVVVNRNPLSPYFGRIYVSVSTPGVNATSGRSVGRGIYVLNPDHTDALGQGDTALTAGLPFSASGTESPYRLSLGPDDKLYISDWSDDAGTVYVTGPNVAADADASLVLSGQGSGFPVGANLHGSIAAAWIEGSLGEGNLTVYVIDEDLQTNPTTTTATERNSLWRWTIGAGPLPSVGPPVKVGSGPLIGTASQTADVVRGPDGKWYLSQRRADNATTTGIFVRGPENTNTLWSSLAATREITANAGAFDQLSEMAAIDVSYDGKYLVAMKRNTNTVIVFPLTNGVPNMTNRIVMPVVPTTSLGRDIGFDAAGNIYSVSSGQGLLRVYSPGGTTVATTGSDGTFSVFVPPPVSLAVVDNLANEAGPDSALFRIIRGGEDLSNPLTVYFALTGTATNGVDYTTVALSATIPAGATNVDVSIDPIDDLDSEPLETVVLTLTSRPEYNLSTPFSGSAAIVDNDIAVVTISATHSNSYERIPDDTARFTFSRVGDTNTELFVYYHFSGTAIASLDYLEPPFPLLISPGQIQGVLAVSPINDSDLEGDETITVDVDPAQDGSYNVGTPSSATARLQDDDDVPPAPVLFSDDFDTDTSANWVVRFGAVNGIYDATYTFAYDYGVIGLPSAPSSVGGSTRGLFAQVNKTNGTAAGSAGINFYPVGQSFSGDFALRFDMYLQWQTNFSTEHALAGINHSGQRTNRVTQNADANNTTAGADGVWVAIETDGSANREYGAYTGTTPTALPTLLTNRSAADFAQLFASPPWGAPGATGSPGVWFISTNRVWADVELSQVNNVFTLKINNNVIYSFPNTTGFSSGNIMLGHNDQFDSIGSPQTFVIFDNVRVVSLALRCTSITVAEDGTVTVDFESPVPALVTDFKLEKSTDLLTWTEDTGATITQLGFGSYRATTTRMGDVLAYRLKR